MVDFAELTEDRILMVDALLDGDATLLANFIEAGGKLSDRERRVLVSYLRGELKRARGRGRRRTYAQDSKERGVRLEMWDLQYRSAISGGSRGSFERAIDAYLERHPGMAEDSLRRYVGGRGLSDGLLRSIDEARAEFFAEHPECK